MAPIRKEIVNCERTVFFDTSINYFTGFDAEYGQLTAQ